MYVYVYVCMCVYVCIYVAACTFAKAVAHDQYLDKVEESFQQVAWFPGVLVSIDNDRAEEEVDVGREGADLGLHLA